MTHSSYELSREALLEHWQSEAESAFLYAALAPKMKDKETRAALERLSRDETAHKQHFENLLSFSR
jgi:rubrerythrin